MAIVCDDSHRLITVPVHAMSVSDALGYRGQSAVAKAVAEGEDYRIVGGHMVRLLLQVYPTPAATSRSTTDADTALGSVEVVGPVSQNLMAQDFTKEGGNLFFHQLPNDHRIEINLLLSRDGPVKGIRPTSVQGVGQVDTLPELRFALMQPAVVLEIVAHLRRSEIIEYQTRIPGVEAVVVLKAHSWKERRSEKDLADLHSLLEIREVYPDIPWRLNEEKKLGFRKDTADILKDLGNKIIRKSMTLPAPHYVDRLRFASLIAKHVP